MWKTALHTPQRRRNRRRHRALRPRERLDRPKVASVVAGQALDAHLGRAKLDQPDSLREVGRTAVVDALIAADGSTDHIRMKVRFNTRGRAWLWY